MVRHLPQFCVLLAALAASRALAAQPELIPTPAKLEVHDGSFTLGPSTTLTVTPPSPSLAAQARALLGTATGFALADGPGPGVAIAVDPSLSTALGDEGYRLDSSPAGVRIAAATEAGAFYGLQTLRQLLPHEIYRASPEAGVSWTLPAVSIEDRPRFKWRGMMLDCSRHFFRKEDVERFIDLMSVHKLNTFHWHLTDDQGWRLEIKRYPKLTSVGAWRKETLVGHPGSGEYDHTPHGGFYTQDDVREVVAFAAARHVTVVPEIEMPGHSKAAVAAYPELGCTGKQVEVSGTWGVEKDILNPTESTIAFYKNVLTEVADLFPGPYVHIGGDEAVKDQWNASPEIVRHMRDLGVPNANAMQSWFIRQISPHLVERHKRMLGWDEILDGGVENLPSDAVIMSWRSMDGGRDAAMHGHDAVMTPTFYTYFDSYQTKDTAHEPLAIGGYIPISQVYEFEPIPKDLPPQFHSHILGGQAQLWAEYLPVYSQVEYMAFPRECALAEVLWSPLPRAPLGDFESRLAAHLERLATLGVHFHPSTPANAVEPSAARPAPATRTVVIPK
jgi:hexosaminidase